MANPEHVEVARQGAEAIAKWRRKHPKQQLDLTHADLNGADLSRVDLSGSRLFRANLTRADLTETRLLDADLSLADLSLADLRWARLDRANLFGASLEAADLREISLWDADLEAATLSRGTASQADLHGARLWRTVLTMTTLNGGRLDHASLNSPRFVNTDLSQVVLEHTALIDVDLSQVRGLAAVEHRGPSSVDVGTLVASVRGSGGHLTADLTAFFRGAGVPHEILDTLPAVVSEMRYYSCFISHGQPDLEFATKLYEDLKARGISCWLYNMDKTAGKRTWSEIGESRRGADKFVVVCSAAALVRPGVRKEIEEQIDEDPEKLVPISLDDLWTQPGFLVVRDGRDLKPFLMERNRPDFSGWDSHPSRYDAALGDLLRGLRRPDIRLEGAST